MEVWAAHFLLFESEHCPCPSGCQTLMSSKFLELEWPLATLTEVENSCCHSARRTDRQTSNGATLSPRANHISQSNISSRTAIYRHDWIGRSVSLDPVVPVEQSNQCNFLSRCFSFWIISQISLPRCQGENIRVVWEMAKPAGVQMGAEQGADQQLQVRITRSLTLSRRNVHLNV